VTLSDSGNVTKGDKLTYDLATGEATVDTGAAAGQRPFILARATAARYKTGAPK